MKRLLLILALLGLLAAPAYADVANDDDAASDDDDAADDDDSGDDDDSSTNGCSAAGRNTGAAAGSLAIALVAGAALARRRE
jgi:uncharacterized protein (TIGR03382 family)